MNRKLDRRAFVRAGVAATGLLALGTHEASAQQFSLPRIQPSVGDPVLTSKKILILTMHGMGSQDQDYDSRLKSELLKRWQTAVKRDVHFGQIYFQDILSGQQERVWSGMMNEKIDGRDLREFFLYNFSDATAYQHRAGEQNSIYSQVHQRIRNVLASQRIAMGEDCKVVILAHSLGGHVISDYIWDVQRRRGIWQDTQPTRFEELSTLRYLITFGCNIPLFVSGLREIVAITKPNSDFRWVNIYDRDDILGWPLRPLSSGFPNSYADVVSEDIEINVGPTPLCHTGYWKSRQFTNRVAAMVTALHGTLVGAPS